MLTVGAIIAVSSGLGYLLPALIGLESMGIPSPGETALILAAVLASQGKLQIWLVIVIAAASAILGDNIGYWLGRELGRRVLTAPGPLYSHRVRLVDSGEAFFAKHGPKSVFIGRWIALVRFAVAWFAGIEEMPAWEFFLYNAAGGITWATAYGLVGYYGGKAAADAITHYGVIAAIVLAVLLAGYLGWRAWRKRRAPTPSEPSSTAAGPGGPGSAATTADAAETGADAAERGADAAERGADGDERGADAAERGADGDERGADGAERGADGDDHPE